MKPVLGQAFCWRQRGAIEGEGHRGVFAAARIPRGTQIWTMTVAWTMTVGKRRSVESFWGYSTENILEYLN